MSLTIEYSSEWQRMFNERKAFHESKRRARGVSHMPDAEYAVLLAEVASSSSGAVTETAVPMSAARFEQLLSALRRGAGQITETAPEPVPAASGPELTSADLARMTRDQLDAHATKVWDARFAAQDARLAQRSPFWAAVEGTGRLGLGGDAA